MKKLFAVLTMLGLCPFILGCPGDPAVDPGAPDPDRVQDAQPVTPDHDHEMHEPADPIDQPTDPAFEPADPTFPDEPADPAFPEDPADPEPADPAAPADDDDEDF